MSNAAPSQRNRRIWPRRIPRVRVRLECQKGIMGLGRNIGHALIDVSETGARLIVTAELAPNQEVALAFQGAGYVRALKTLGDVMWCVPIADGQWQVGVRFQKKLQYGDLVRTMG